MLCRDEFFDLDMLKTQQVFQINAIAPLFLSRFCVNSMIEQQTPGHIINISSIQGLLSNSVNPVYAASKAAINTWTKNIARTLAPHGILVNWVDRFAWLHGKVGSRCPYNKLFPQLVNQHARHQPQIFCL